MKKYIQHIAASLLALSVFVGCTQQARQLADVPSVQSVSQPVPASSAETTPAEPLMASASTTPSALSNNRAVTDSHKDALHLVGSNHVTTTASAVVATDNVTLLIDSGAVSRDVEISILATTEEHSGSIPENLANLTVDGAVYRMLPDGQKFEKDITIAMSYDSTALPYGYTPEDIYTFFYNEETHLWQQVERDSVDTENQIVYSRTNHFTDYINGVLKVPESNDAMAYTPTSIKDLKAADPMEGITMIAPPEANNMGTANLSYPLQIPAGRRGMQPNLAVTYNSAGGSGILGLGWSLPISEISVDTRRGVPLFDADYQTETYAIDGEILVTSYTDDNGLLHLNKPAYATPWKHRDHSGQIQYYPRVEGAFRRIIRHGTVPSDYYWVVTDKNGTKYYYGETDSSRLKDSQGNIAKWCLSRVVDTYGNDISYTYTPYTYNVPNSTNVSRQLLLSKINYTGHASTSEQGRYGINLTYAQQDKVDAVTSARFGFLEADAALLDHITVVYDHRPIRNYVFGYKQGAFGRTLLCNIIEADPSTYTSVCSECSGTEAKGRINYHEPDIGFCGNTSFFDSIAQVRKRRSDDTKNYIYPDTIPFFNLCISDSTDYYSDHCVIDDTLMSSIFSRDVYSRCSETDSTCIHPAYTEHRFSYSGVPLFMLSQTDYIANEDRVQDDIKGPLFLVKGSPGPIEGTGTRSWNIGGAVDAGFGTNTFLKTITLGGSYTYSNSKSEGLVTLVDLNGDGFPDKIYKRGDAIYYRLRDASEYNRFLEEHQITGLKDFLHSTSVGNSWGVEGCVGAGGVGVSFGLNWSDGNSGTTTYFSDMNGDGLPDIVHNGIVLYNHIDEDESNVFVPAASGLEYMVISSCGRNDTIYIGEPVDEDIFADFVDTTIMVCDTIYIGEQIEHVECNPYTYTSPRPYTPNLENVRFWQAPESGYVHITDSAHLLHTTLASGDGVRLIVQHHDHIISSDTLLPNTDTAFLDTVIYVTEGERIYFRVQSMGTRTADRLMWNPTVAYCTSSDDTAEWTGTNNVGQDEYRYSYEKDFLLSGLQKIKMPFDADVHIEATAYDRSGSSPANYAELQVLVNGGNVLYIPISGTSSTDSINLPLNKWDSIQVRIVADGDINWSNIESQCRIYITNNNATDDDSLFACIDTLSYEDSTIYFYDYYPQVQKLVYSTDADPNTVYMYGDYDANEYSQFGTMYRNWGQFGYKTPSNSSSDIIQESLLNDTELSRIQGNGQSSYENISSGSDLTLDTENQETAATIGGLDAYNPLASPFFLMQPDFKRGCWTAYSNYAYIERSMLSNLPHPADGMSIAQIDSSEYESSMPIYTPGAVAISKKTFNSSFGVSGNVNANIKGIGWSGSANFTKSESRQLADMLDLNGDGLPDVLSEVKVQYSHPFGGLSTKTGNLYKDGLYSEYSLDTVYGGSFSGSAIRMLWQPANNTRRSSKSISGNVGANLGGALGHGGSATTWVDINGDGLPDKVYCDETGLYYYQNIGYGLLPRTRFADGHARHSSSKGVSGGASLGGSFEQTWLNQEGAALDDLANSLPDSLSRLANRIRELLGDQKYNNKLNVSITAGFGASYSENTTDVLTLDINGDGLPDRLEKHGSSYLIQFNNGNGFGWSNAVLHLTKDLDNVSYSTDLTSAITVGVTFGFIPLKIEANPKGGLSRSLSRTEAQWTDMNGDGIPDYIWDAGDGYIGVRYSRLGEANRLTSVSLPSGGSYTIGYKINDDGPESNMRHYVMSSLTVKDNRMHSPDQCRRFEYGSRHYDRLEREDYGYSDVVTIEDSARRLDYRRTVQQYHNQDYLFRGLCHSTAVISGTTNDTLSSTRQEYRLFEIESGDLIQGSKPGCYGDGFPAIQSDSTIYYDRGRRQIVSRLRFGYTTLGNIDTVYDDGALNDPDDDYVAATSYSSMNDYISVVANEHVFFGSNTLRYREATYYPTGAMQTLTFRNNASTDAAYDFSYDIYGNIVEILQPENHQGQRFYIRYGYDSEVHALPIETSNAYGLSSYAKYDYRWQKPIWTMSANDAQSEYRYDEQGRLKELYAPFEYGTSHPTIRYEYYDGYPQTDAYWRHCLPWARTLNDNGSNYIPTVTISDGLGRPRVVKKEASVNGQVKRIVSGYADIDALGRKMREYYPDIEDTIYPDSTYNTQITTLSSRFFYDGLDRVTKTIYPDSTFTTSSYTVGTDAFGVLRLETDATDQNGHTSKLFSSVREQNTTTVNPIGATTKFVYDRIGQLSMTISPDGDSTKHTYDLFGRRTNRFHPSSGHTHWDYDPAGNMIKQTQNNGEEISYEYDYTRPVHISYSSRPWNDVWYEYGAAGSGTQSGRIVRMQDATGVQSMEYDDMGNMVFNRHTYVQPHSPNALTLSTEWKYDSWGRLLEITYPDLEKVYYHYDLGGALTSVKGFKPGVVDSTFYIRDIRYDHFGQRTYILDGDSVETRYQYEPYTRRLSHLVNYSHLANEVLQDNKYEYDNVGNIISIQDEGRNPRIQTFSYDAANRLIRSEGDIPQEYSSSAPLSYRTQLNYSPAGKLLSKHVDSRRLSTTRGLFPVFYDNSYHYNDPNNPYAVTSIHDSYGSNYDFNWDANGNLGHSFSQSSNTHRRLCWTEDNRLQAFMENGDDGGIAAYYNYAADGERNLKLTSPRINIQQNAALLNNPSLIYPTLYASPLITLTKHGYTKHYFEEGHRICSKIGGGFRNVRIEEVDEHVPELKFDYGEQHHRQKDGVGQTFNACMGVAPQIDRGVDLYKMLVVQEYIRDEQEPAFYYHSDHLGSAAYLTNNGQVTQTLNYLPYGEDWVDIQHYMGTRYSNMELYTFTGKEKDSESGYHYFGARYYDSEALTGWLSVDPMADKYPSVSPYNYCAWNPMIFVDPDGNIPWRSLVNGFGNKVPSSVPMSARLQPKMNKIRPHHGLDMPAVKGAAVNSAASGTVIFAGNMNGYGNAVIVNHGKGFYTLYAHLNSIAVQLNDEISNGQQIGQVGETGGVSTGPHLHVEYMYVSGEGNSICNVSRLFKNKNSLVFDPRSVNDLQNIIDGNECAINVPFLDGHTTTLGNIEILSRGNNASFNQAPEPKFSEKLQNNKVPIIKTLGDIISHLE